MIAWVHKEYLNQANLEQYCLEGFQFIRSYRKSGMMFVYVVNLNSATV